ncbi:MAG TPA: MaoC family dehydratase N-terminal domain-containing protein [Candidatus Binataceae bacterium]|nr:MaoC family dehydratase N-terminal domain-containing protein [Candidatus Binataceae bacterium]
MVDRSFIGRTSRTFSMPIEWGKVREFARAIKDPNPAYLDSDFAARVHGGIPIPPTFLMTSMAWEIPEWESGRVIELDYSNGVHGEQEFQLLRPIFVGDVLSWTQRIADIHEKDGARGGKMKFAVIEGNYFNQRGEQVAISRSVMIEFPPRPAVA